MPGVATPEGYTHAPVADRQPEPAKDPLQITLDLRKLSPARWGAGAKSFAVVLLLVGAFFLGSYAGAAFERTRDELGAGIGDIKALGSSQDDANTAPGDDGDAQEDNGTLGVGGVIGAGDGTGDGTGNSSDEGETNSTDPADPADEDPPPDDGSGETRFVFADTGEGEASTDTFTTQQDLLRVRIELYNDDPSYQFSVRFKEPGEARPAKTLSASDAGEYRGVERYVSVPAGTYYLDFEFSGPEGDFPPWDIIIEEPRGEDASSDRSFSAHGDTGLPPVWLDGSVTLTMDDAGRTGTDVRAYSAEGVWLQSCWIDTSSSTASCELTEPTKVYFDVAAPYDPAEWELQIGS